MPTITWPRHPDLRRREFALSSDSQRQLQDLNIEFLDDKSITVDDYIERYASIIEDAEQQRRREADRQPFLRRQTRPGGT